MDCTSLHAVKTAISLYQRHKSLHHPKKKLITSVGARERHLGDGVQWSGAGRAFMDAVWGTVWPASATSPGPMRQSGGRCRDDGTGIPAPQIGFHKGPLHPSTPHSPLRITRPAAGLCGFSIPSVDAHWAALAVALLATICHSPKKHATMKPPYCRESVKMYGRGLPSPC